MKTLKKQSSQRDFETSITPACEALVQNLSCGLHGTPWPLIKGPKSPGELLPNESLPPIAGHLRFRQTFIHVYILTSDTIKNGVLDLLIAKITSRGRTG